MSKSPRITIRGFLRISAYREDLYARWPIAYRHQSRDGVQFRPVRDKSLQYMDIRHFGRRLCCGDFSCMKMDDNPRHMTFAVPKSAHMIVI